MTALDTPSSVAPAPPARRAWPWAVAAVLPLALLAAWLWVGTHPVLGEGPVHRPESMQTANDGVSDTRYVAPPGGGDMVVSLRNEGRTAVRVAAPPVERSVPILALRGFQLLDPRGGGPDLQGTWSESVVVPAGRDAALRLRVGTDGCMPYPAGGSATARVLPLSVRALGLSSVQELPLPLPVSVKGPIAAGPGCDE